jgi:DNA transformation protein
MAVRPQFLAYVLEQLSALSGLHTNRMFGAVGLYSDAVFFGLVDDDTLFFKTGESNIARYRERNMPRFMPFPDRARTAFGYHQVPADIIEDAEELVTWARQSVAVAAAAKSRPHKKKKAVAKKRASPKKARVRS